MEQDLQTAKNLINLRFCKVRKVADRGKSPEMELSSSLGIQEKKNIIMKRNKTLREKQGFERQKFSPNEDPFHGQ